MSTIHVLSVVGMMIAATFAIAGATQNAVYAQEVREDWRDEDGHERLWECFPNSEDVASIFGEEEFCIPTGNTRPTANALPNTEDLVGGVQDNFDNINVDN